VLSHHLPLHRVLARLLLLGLQRGAPAEELVGALPLDAAAAEAVMEHPLRLQLLPLQLRLRWWVGNGRVPWAADRFYRRLRLGVRVRVRVTLLPQVRVGVRVRVRDTNPNPNP